MRIVHADIHLIDLRTRLPFQYGIATMTHAPHVFVRTLVELEGRTVCGIAADVLPPKWFTKVPEKPLDEEVDEMLSVIEHAAQSSIGLHGQTTFDLWRQLFDLQDRWGSSQKLPSLLTQFGTSLIERALIEAACKLVELPFADAVRKNRLGIQLGELVPGLAGAEPGDLLPEKPRTPVIARHTIGMADPLTSTDIAADERLGDGLPQALSECIGCYRLRHFKVKVSGDLKYDLPRVRRIAALIAEHGPPDFAFTMDGNEQFRTLESFREFWQSISRAGGLSEFFGRLLFVEQPFHRDVALDPDILNGLRKWIARPLMIIDESDAEPGSLHRALDLGYHGTSHKNCKGIFKSIANACLLQQRRRDDPQATLIMSGEDLVNIGPVALLQDLAAAAALGVESIERNGHHYLAGLSAFPPAVQRQTLQAHADLYRKTEAGWPTLNIQNGKLDLRSVNAAPFGVGFELDVEAFLPVAQWRRQQAGETTQP